MTTLSLLDLTEITGGITQPPAGSRAARYKEMCTVPDRATARKQYDWMRAHQIPDASEAPGVKKRVVDAIGTLCGWK